MILTSRQLTSTEDLGTGFELSAIAAAVVGGASLLGGVGGALGPVIGAFLVGTLSVGLTFMGVSTYAQQIVSGAILVFVPAVGEYVIPELVGNSNTMMIGGILWEEFFQNRDWPLAAAIAIVTFGLLMAPALLLRRSMGRLVGAGL